MANDLSALPYILDSPSDDPVIVKPLNIMWIRWCAPNAKPGDRCMIADVKGRMIWESVANGPNYVDNEHFSAGDRAMKNEGLIVKQLDSGIIYIGL